METLIHADIFFFVTTIVVVVIALVVLIALIYLILILRDIRDLSRIIRHEGAEIAEDVATIRQELRHDIRTGSSGILALIGFFTKLFKHRKKK